MERGRIAHHVKVGLFLETPMNKRYSSCRREAYCEMKIKEKGLTGKAASLRKDSLAGPTRKGFNAFREMAREKDGRKDKRGGAKAGSKPEVWLEFMGQKIRVHEEDGGSIKPEDVSLVKGASLKFEGVEGDVSFDDIKVHLHYS